MNDRVDCGLEMWILNAIGRDSLLIEDWMYARREARVALGRSEIKLLFVILPFHPKFLLLLCRSPAYVVFS